MAIPFNTTFVTVSRPTTVDVEPYDGEPNKAVVATHVRAVIGAFSRTVSATEYRAGGEEASTILKLTCDIPPSKIDHLDWIVDETTGVEYQVNWAFERVGLGLDHMTCEIQRIQGLR